MHNVIAIKLIIGLSILVMMYVMARCVVDGIKILNRKEN
jgi:hypothetical protein